MRKLNFWRASTAFVLLLAATVSAPRLVRLASQSLRRGNGGSPAAPGLLPSAGEDVAARAPSPQSPATSGLDLLRAPADLAPAGKSAPPAPANIARLQSGARGMLDSLAPLLASPGLSQNLDSARRRDLQELQTLIAEMKKQMSAGKSLSDRDYSMKMRRLQSLTLKLMSAAAAGPGRSIQPASREGK